MTRTLFTAATISLALTFAVQAEDVPFFTMEGDVATHTPSGGVCPVEFVGLPRYALMAEKIGRWTVKVRLSIRAGGDDNAVKAMQGGSIVLQTQRETIKGQ